MASKDGFTPEDVAEQWIFDFYFIKCLTEREQNQQKEMSKNTRQILQMLMEQTIDVEYESNHLKANLLIVITYQLQLEELHLDRFPWPRNFSLLQSKVMVTELLSLIKNLRRSLCVLESSEELQSSRIIHSLCRSCLFHTDVFMLQVLDQLRDTHDELFETSQVEGWMQKTFQLLQRRGDEIQEKEKKMYQTCKGILKKDNEAWKVLPQPEEFCNLLSNLLTEISKSVFPQPQLLQFAECYLRIQSKLEEEGEADLVTHGPSSMASLEKLARLNKTYSAVGDKQNDEHSRKVAKLWSRQRARGRSRSNSSGKRRDPSRSRSSSRSSSSSEASSDISSSRSHRATAMSKAALKFKQENIVDRVRPLPLHHKPASHARVRCGKWTPSEEVKFVVSVLKLGVGNWMDIKEDIGSARSTMQLKDKWRNIPKSRAKSIAREHGLSMPSE